MAHTRTEEGLAGRGDGAHTGEGSGGDVGDLGGFGIGDEPCGEEGGEGGHADEEEVQAGADGTVAVGMRSGARGGTGVAHPEQPIPQHKSLLVGTCRSTASALPPSVKT